MWGNPIYDGWMVGALLKSDTSVQWANEMEAWRDRLDKDIDSAGRPIVGGQQPSSLIQIGEEPDLEQAFDLDWSQMRWAWLPTLTEAQRASLRFALKANYGLIISIFLHYCGPGLMGQRYGLTISEFGHLLHLAGVLDWNTQSDVVLGMFEKTSGGAMGGASASASSASSGGGGGGRGGGAVCPLMSRSHLCQAIVGVAVDLEMGSTVSQCQLYYLSLALLTF